MPDRDAALQAAAQQCLNDNLSLPREQVSIDVLDAWITLTGSVEWQFQIAAAEHGLREIPGIKGLTNRVTVQS